MSETRPRRDLTQNFGRDRDETESLGFFFFTRPRREPTFNEEIYSLFGSFLLKTTHPDQDKTETRLSENKTNEMRPGRDYPKNFHPRRDKFQNLVRDRDGTKSLGTFSLKTETRPRLSSFTA